MQEATSPTLLAASHSRTVLSSVLRFTGGVIAVLMMLFVFVIAINLKDESLSPSAEAFLALSKKPIEMTNNGYVVLNAIDADESLDVFKIGQEVTAQLTRVAQDDASRRDGVKPLSYQKSPAFTWHTFHRQSKECKDGTDFCIKADLSHRKVLEEALAQNALLLKRYVMIQALPQFSEAPTTIFTELTLGNNLALWQGSDMVVTEAVLDIADGKTKEGIEQLQRNDLALRRLLRQSSSLLTKMMVRSMLREQVRTISELMEVYPQLVTSEGDALATMLVPLTSDELSLVSTFNNEAQYSLNYLTTFMHAQPKEQQDLSDRFYSLFYQAHATQNTMADHWTKVIQSLNVLPSELDRARSKIQGMSEAMNDHAGVPYLHFLYNPVGKTLFYGGVAPSDIALSEMERMADLDGYIRLVGLQLDSRRHGITNDKMQAYVNEAKEPFRNPYNHAPMTWDATHQQLQFTGRQAYQDKVGARNIYVVKML